MANPTWKTARSHSGALAFFLLLFCPESIAHASADSTAALRAMGARIKLAVDRADAGFPVDNAQVRQFAHALAEVRNTARATTDAQFETKRRAVERLFARLEYQVANSAAGSLNLSSSQWHSRYRTDIEAVVPRHGDSCKTALGISEALPVEVTVVRSGKGPRDAWFRFEPDALGRYRFRTHSSGPDPAIEIFRGCRSGDAAIASNDDEFGLDAGATVESQEDRALIVHLTNASRGGSIALSVEAANATISGKLMDAVTGQPLVGANVEAFVDSYDYAGQTTTNEIGIYALDIAPGSYYLRAASDGHVSQLFPNVACTYRDDPFTLLNCDIASGQSIVVASGATASGIDFALPLGRAVAGTIRDASNKPVQGTIFLFDAAGNPFDWVNSDAFGRYILSPLAAGAYKLSASSNGYGAQMFNHVACGGPLQSQCDLAQASVVLVADNNITGVDFTLTRFATIQGKVSEPGSIGAFGYFVQISVLDAYGNPVADVFTDSDGHYDVGPLDTGSYFVYATDFANDPGHFPQIFNGVDCAENCDSSIAAATPVTLSSNGQVAEADFQLTPLPDIHGHVQDVVSGLPLANVIVYASATPPASFSTVDLAVTDANGDYTLSELRAGKYYLWARSQDHIDQIYPGIACEGRFGQFNVACDVSSAVLVALISEQVPGPYDFALQASSKITGSAITRAGAGSELPALSVLTLYDGAGVVVASSQTDTLGQYVINDLQSSEYFLSAGSSGYNDNLYVTQLWQQIDCPTYCAPSTGTPIPVPLSVEVSGVDFDLTRLDAIVGQVTDTLGAPVSNVLVDTFDSATGKYFGTGETDAQGYYATPGSLGHSYFVATAVSGGYVDQVYSGIACPAGPAYFGLCSLLNATPVGLSSQTTQPRIVDFALKSNDPIFASGFE